MTEFEKPRLDEELYQHRDAPMAMGINPQDGMPQSIFGPTELAAPLLTRESLICMADTREFVLRQESDGRILIRVSPDVVERAPNGGYRVTREKGVARYGERLEVIIGEYRRDRGYLRDWDYFWVEPIRPQCAHYKRGMVNTDMDADRRLVTRLCIAQKTENGEYYTLRDSAVYACELRTPRDPVSDALLDEFDEEKLREAAREQEEAIPFDPERALANQASSEKSSLK